MLGAKVGAGKLRYRFRCRALPQKTRQNDAVLFKSSLGTGLSRRTCLAFPPPGQVSLLGPILGMPPFYFGVAAS